MAMKITIVMVLYKQKPEESKTYQTLLQALLKKSDRVKELEIILYDNSPEEYSFTPPAIEGIHINYYHDARNLGIATAYNFAWSFAKANNSQWLLLLDHDTELTEAYMVAVLNLPPLTENIAAVVPIINSEKIMISPVFSGSLRPLQGERPVPGIQEKRVMAINSGALIRVDFLNKLNGFNQQFPLDYLDHWLFFEVYERGYKVQILDVALEHELSVMDYSRVSLRRYQSILDSEMIFYQKYEKDLFPSYRSQLFKRLLKQILTVKNKKIAMYTLKRLLWM
jgi:GT2 family glycosyltransferase